MQFLLSPEWTDRSISQITTIFLAGRIFSIGGEHCSISQGGARIRDRTSIQLLPILDSLRLLRILHKNSRCAQILETSEVERISARTMKRPWRRKDPGLKGCVCLCNRRSAGISARSDILECVTSERNS